VVSNFDVRAISRSVYVTILATLCIKGLKFGRVVSEIGPICERTDKQTDTRLLITILRTPWGREDEVVTSTIVEKCKQAYHSSVN